MLLVQSEPNGLGAKGPGGEKPPHVELSSGWFLELEVEMRSSSPNLSPNP